MDAVSVIIPMHNACRAAGADAEVFAGVLRSIVIDQTYAGHVEISIYDDCSTDESVEILRQWQSALERVGGLPRRDLWANEQARLASVRKAVRDGSDVKQLLDFCAGPRSIIITSPADVGAKVPCGPGFGRNRATEASSGAWLCTADADDEFAPDRIERQVAAARAAGAPGGVPVIAGGRFTRTPEGSTPAYTRWANSLSKEDILHQQWRECTMVHPTWFSHRSVYDRIGGYDEKPAAFFDGGRVISVEEYAAGRIGATDGGYVPAGAAPPGVSLTEVAAEGASGDAASSAASAGAAAFSGSGGGTGVMLPRHPPILSSLPERLTPEERAGGRVFAAFPEDLLFFHRHLAGGGTLVQDISAPVICYRYSASSQSFKIPRQFLLRLRVALWEERVLARDPAWGRFIIWGAGRDGKAFYNALSPAGKAGVACFAEVDADKVGHVYPAPPKGQKLVARRAASAAAKAAVAAVAATAPTESGATPATSHGGSERCLCGKKRAREDDSGAVDGAVHAGTALCPGGCSAATTAVDGGADGAGSRDFATEPVPDHALQPPRLMPPPAYVQAEALPGPVSIRHFTDLPPGLPIVVAVYLEAGGEQLRANVAAVAAARKAPLMEGKDLWYFV